MTRIVPDKELVPCLPNLASWVRGACRRHCADLDAMGLTADAAHELLAQLHARSSTLDLQVMKVLASVDQQGLVPVPLPGSDPYLVRLVGAGYIDSSDLSLGVRISDLGRAVLEYSIPFFAIRLRAAWWAPKACGYVGDLLHAGAYSSRQLATTGATRQDDEVLPMFRAMQEYRRGRRPLDDGSVLDVALRDYHCEYDCPGYRMLGFNDVYGESRP